MTLSKTALSMECCYAESHYADCRTLFFVMLCVVMLNVIMVSVLAPPESVARQVAAWVPDMFRNFYLAKNQKISLN
jgi:hypothetical protein